MPITSKQLEKRLVIAAELRRAIRRTTLALRKTGQEIIRKHNKQRKRNGTE